MILFYRLPQQQSTVSSLSYLAISMVMLANTPRASMTYKEAVENDARSEQNVRLWGFCGATGLAIFKSRFKKPDKYLITYPSGMQIYHIFYILPRERVRRAIVNAETFPGQQCIAQT